MDNSAYLSVRNLAISFTNSKEPTVRDVSFCVNSGETLALVGESGSGKTLIADTLMRLRSNVSISGEIILDGQSIPHLSLGELISLRRHKVSYIFQEPGDALNPALTIGYQLLEIADGAHKKVRTLDALKRVGFTDPKKIFRSYPHELSGGMRQRAVIAMALINKPKLLIADEPTTALDMVLQKQILELIKTLQMELGFAMLLVTHDFSLLQRMTDRVCVIHRGKIVERGTPKDIIFYPKHAYTQMLNQSILTLSEALCSREM
ncbi:MAG: ABC transporter ATP-binding protein [Puniceicoccales bacterium]|jgi:ABC-type dipeptide/oligopeptide/nickel transport system ATPase component|nr:ABC transporter ATP-binding protein [Puniceicoccales bacterium]